MTDIKLIFASKYHIYAANPTNYNAQWQGIFKTYDFNGLIRSLVKYLKTLSRGLTITFEPGSPSQKNKNEQLVYAIKFIPYFSRQKMKVRKEYDGKYSSFRSYARRQSEHKLFGGSWFGGIAFPLIVYSISYETNIGNSISLISACSSEMEKGFYHFPLFRAFWRRWIARRPPLLNIQVKDKNIPSPSNCPSIQFSLASPLLLPNNYILIHKF